MTAMSADEQLPLPFLLVGVLRSPLAPIVPFPLVADAPRAAHADCPGLMEYGYMVSPLPGSSSAFGRMQVGMSWPGVGTLPAD